jgi:hypothetical protein
MYLVNTKGVIKKMINGIALFGWTFIVVVALAFITIYVGDHLND